MIKNLIFDYGGVVLDWNPHYLYDSYFGSVEKSDWFLDNVCTYKWNSQHDAGKPLADGIREKIAEFPDWEKEIRMYYGRWIEMVNGPVQGTLEYARELKSRNYGLYGLTNWSVETFPLICGDYEFFKILDGMVISGEEHMLKPQPEIYRRLYDKFSLNPQECVFIDDNQENVRGAIDTGMRAIRFCGVSKLKSDLEELLRSDTNVI